jgi:hypothetical protein
MSISRKRVLTIEVLKKRLENIPNKLNMDCQQWGELCCAILPELFGQKRKEPKPSNSQPGSSERLQIYIGREAAGESIFSKSDWIPTKRTL